MPSCSRSTRRTTEQRFNEDGQVRQVLDQLLDPRLELYFPPSNPETKVAQSSAQVVLDSDGFRLQQLAMGQKSFSVFLAA